MNNFKKQQDQIKKLNRLSLKEIKEEMGTNNPSEFLSNPDDFQKNIYYHNAKFSEDKNSILENGFDFTKMDENIIALGLGMGLYVGRDKNALIKCYSFEQENNLIQIKGNFDFFDIIDDEVSKKFYRKFKDRKKIASWILNNDYDGIRYYDPFTVGEEFVIFNLKKVKINDVL